LACILMCRCSPTAVAALPLLAVVSVCTLALGQKEEQREFTFVTERKTGQNFVNRVMRHCLIPWPAVGRLQQEFLAATLTKNSGIVNNFRMPLEWGKIVYMVRGPYELIVSDYFYSKDPKKSGRETFLRQPATWRIENTTLLHDRPLLPNESLAAYLRRVPMADGILALMAGNTGRVIRWMESNYANNGAQERILLVCLGDLFMAFNKTMQSILQHIGVAKFSVVHDEKQELWRCLKTLDPSTHVFAHGTRDVAVGVRQQAMRLVKEHDARHWGGRFSRSPLAALCEQERPA